MTYRRLVVAWSLVLWAAAAATSQVSVATIATYWAIRVTGRALDPAIGQRTSKEAGS